MYGAEEANMRLNESRAEVAKLREENECLRLERDSLKKAKQAEETNRVTVRWFDGYLEEFECSEVRFGGYLLFLRLVDGKNRHIPIHQVRWYSLSKESHERE